MVIKRQAPAPFVIGYDLNVKDLRTAVKMGAIDEFVNDPSDCVRGADLAVLSIPVGSDESHLQASSILFCLKTIIWCSGSQPWPPETSLDFARE